MPRWPRRRGRRPSSMAVRHRSRRSNCSRLRYPLRSVVHHCSREQREDRPHGSSANAAAGVGEASSRQDALVLEPESMCCNATRGLLGDCHLVVSPCGEFREEKRALSTAEWVRVGRPAFTHASSSSIRALRRFISGRLVQAFSRPTQFDTRMMLFSRPRSATEIVASTNASQRERRTNRD